MIFEPLIFEPFDVCMMDPPWKYNNYDEYTGGGRAASVYYKTRNVVDTFGDLPMNQLMAKNSLIFIWATMPNLAEVWPLVDAWNASTKYKYQRFTYRTVGFNWAKLCKNWHDIARAELKNGVTDEALDRMIVRIFKPGLGFYTMANIEPLLIFGRGSMKGALRRAHKDLRQFQAHPIMEHSKKPDAFNALLDRLFPPAKKTEFFARRVYDSAQWNCMGYEISGNDIHKDIDMLLHPEKVDRSEPILI